MKRDPHEEASNMRKVSTWFKFSSFVFRTWLERPPMRVARKRNHGSCIIRCESCRNNAFPEQAKTQRFPATTMYDAPTYHRIETKRPLQ